MVRVFSLAVVGLFITTGCGPYPDPCEDDSADTGDSCETDDETTVVEQACEEFWIGDQPTFDNAGTVYGRVVAPNGSIAAVGATVALQVDGVDVWMLTQCDGEFSLQLPAGSHQISVQKGHFTANRTVEVGAGVTNNLGNLHLDTSQVKMAVISGIYDDIGSMVSDLGIPYDTFARPEDILGNTSLLTQYQVVFANCGTVATTTGQNHYTQEQFNNTRSWVEQGGTLYTSDWEYQLFEGVVPEAVTFSNNPLDGPVAQLEANVLDREIQMLLGGTKADIYFDLNGWATIEKTDAAMTLVEAKIPGRSGQSPLATRMILGSGKAIFTSFHNEEQLTEDMERILYEMILSL